MNTKTSLTSLLFTSLVLTFLSASGQEEFSVRTQAAKQTIMLFAKELGGALKTELGKGDPSSAIGVCSDIAPAIANRLSFRMAGR